jgi:hypothetical protein
MKRLILAALCVATAAFGADGKPTARPKALSDCDTTTRRTIMRALDAMGGADKLRSLKTLRQVGVVAEKARRRDAEFFVVFPDKAQFKLTSRGTEMRTVVSPEAVLLYDDSKQLSGVPLRFHDADADETRVAYSLNPLVAFSRLEDPSYQFRMGGTTVVNGTSCTIIQVFRQGVSRDWMIDDSGRLLRVVLNEEHRVTVDYSDFRPVGGLTLPFHEVSSVAGATTTQQQVSGYAMNEPVPADLFRIPAATMWVDAIRGKSKDERSWWWY